MKIKLNIILFILMIQVFLFCTSSVAQTEKPKGKSELRVDSLNNRCAAIIYDDRKQARILAEKALKIAISVDYTKGIGAAFNIFGIIYLFEGNYDSAVHYYRKAISKFESIGYEKGVANCSNNMGLIYESWGDYQTALAYMQKSLEYDLKSGDREGIASSYNNVAGIYYYLADYDRSLDYYRKSAGIYDELDNQKEKISCLMNIGAIYEAQGIIEEAIRLNKEVIILCKQYNYGYYEAIAQNNLGSNYLKLNKPSEAISYLNIALVQRDEMQDRQGISSTLKLIGEYYEKTGQPDLAIETYFRSLKISEELEDKRAIAECFTLIGTNLLEKGNAQGALDYFGQSLEIATDIGARSEILANYRRMAMTYASMNAFDSSEIYFEKYTALNDSISIKDKLKKGNRPAAPNNDQSGNREYKNIRLILWAVAFFILFTLITILIRKKRLK